MRPIRFYNAKTGSLAEELQIIGAVPENTPYLDLDPIQAHNTSRWDHLRLARAIFKAYGLDTPKKGKR